MCVREYKSAIKIDCHIIFDWTYLKMKPIFYIGKFLSLLKNNKKKYLWTRSKRMNVINLNIS